MPKEDFMIQKVQCVIRGAGQQVDFSDAKFLFDFSGIDDCSQIVALLPLVQLKCKTGLITVLGVIKEKKK